jgi:hypothetical protein
MNQRTIASKAQITFDDPTAAVLPCDEWPDDISVRGMTADQIWNRMEQYVRSEGKSEILKYGEVSNYLRTLSHEIGGYDNPNWKLIHLSNAATAAAEEKKAALLGDKKRIQKANESKWGSLAKSKSAKAAEVGALR